MIDRNSSARNNYLHDKLSSLIDSWNKDEEREADILDVQDAKQVPASSTINRALNYVYAIRNPGKKEYARQYIMHKPELGHNGPPPDQTLCSGMARQAVMHNIEAILRGEQI